MRVLELDGEPERIDEIVDAQIEARAQSALIRKSEQAPFLKTALFGKMQRSLRTQTYATALSLQEPESAASI